MDVPWARILIIFSCVYVHAYMASLLTCDSAEQIGRVVEDGALSGGALPSLAMLTLECFSIVVTDEIDPGALAHTQVPPFTWQAQA